MDWSVWLLVGLGAYLGGAFPFDNVVSSVLDAVFRGGGDRLIAFARVCANIVKGWVVVYCACLISQEMAYLAALLVFLGHVFPPQSGFNGGNGMGTLLGVMVGLHPVLGLVALISWAFTFYVYRYACLAAVVATAMTPIVSATVDLGVPLPLLIAMAIVVFYRHRICAVGLTDGTEKMFDWDQHA